MLQTYFGSLDHYERLSALPVQGLGLDFVYDDGENLQHILQYGFPKGKTLGAGVIDGRNIWRSDLNAVATLLGQLAEQTTAEQLIVQPSCSLLHVPVSLEAEHKLDRELVQALAFADEKLEEIAVLTAALGKHDPSALTKLGQSADAVARFNSSAARVQTADDLADLLAKEPLTRSVPFAERREIQQNKLKLPPLPTTTIGSFPQTAEIRKAACTIAKENGLPSNTGRSSNSKSRNGLIFRRTLALTCLYTGNLSGPIWLNFLAKS